MTGRKLRAGRHSKKSRFACSTCKSRKLKCDEARPSCARCLKAGRSCEYQDTAPFKIVQPSSSPQRRPLPKTHKDTPSASNIDLVWVNDVDTAGNTEAAPPSPENDTGSTVSPPPAYSATLKSTSAPVKDDYGGEVERLMSLRLTRHFKESPAQWMDAFDTASYFSCKAPVRATSSALLKSSMCALAAKHLYRLQSASKGQNTLAAKSFLSDDELHMDWEWYAAHYYDKAIRCLKAAINSITFNPDLPENAVEQECIFAAVAILSTYELIDAPGTAWKAHLGVLPVFNPSSLPHSTPSDGEHSQAVIHKPIFWCLARQDFLCAFISETQTRLNLNDRRLWQNAGLAVDDDGVRLPLSPSSSTNAYASAADVEEDRHSNKLTWLLSHIVNHLTSGDALWPEDYAKPLGQRCPVGVTQEQLLDRWYALMGELDGWYSGLVSSFKPVATAPYTGPEGSGAASGLVKTWFEIPLCAATMQSYHMARILLLVNRPQESTAIRSTVSARLRSYRDAIEQALYHSRQICGISLARPADPVRIHSVQPLFVAGQVFHTENEQRVVLSLLSGIESDLGWSTSYHIKKLGQEWSTSGDVY